MKTTHTAPTASGEIQEENTAQRVGYFVLLFGMSILALSFLSSCNTTRGFGRDVQKVGSRIENRAAQVQSGN